MQPEFEDETPINPFDFWEGANFKLKIRKVDGYWNYDASSFENVSALKMTMNNSRYLQEAVFVARVSCTYQLQIL